MESNVEQIQQLQSILQIVFRRRVLLLSCLLFALTAGLILYLLQDKYYQTSALIVYQQQKVNPAKMSPDEQGRLKDVVSTLAPLVTSRTNLEDIINSEKLFLKELEKRPMHDVVLTMRKRIEIIPSRQGNTFTISYWDVNPQVVARVTNILAGKFVEENLRQRQDRAVETSNYTQDELEMAKQTLDQKEAVLRDYKLKYYNEMPEQRQDNMSRLTSLQEQYQGKQESIQDLEKTRILILDQINGRRQLLEQVPDAMVSQTQKKSGEVKPLSPWRELQSLKRTRELLLQRYTEKHPKIRILDKKISALAKVAVPEQDREEGADEQGFGEESIPDKILFGLRLQLKEIGLSIQKITEEMAVTRGQIEKYEKWVAAAPVREAEWAAISREYGELKRHYDFLVAQNLQARSVMNLERNQQGSQFKIKDTAQVPLKPVKPNFLKYMAMALLVGSGIGGGIALFLEFLDTSFRDPDRLERAFGVDVIASIPRFSLPHELRKKRRRYLAEGAVFFLWSAGLLLSAFFFWSRGNIVV